MSWNPNVCSSFSCITWREERSQGSGPRVSTDLCDAVTRGRPSSWMHPGDRTELCWCWLGIMGVQDCWEQASAIRHGWPASSWHLSLALWADGKGDWQMIPGALCLGRDAMLSYQQCEILSFGFSHHILYLWALQPWIFSVCLSCDCVFFQLSHSCVSAWPKALLVWTETHGLIWPWTWLVIIDLSQRPQGFV